MAGVGSAARAGGDLPDLFLFVRFSILSEGDIFNQRGARYHRLAPLVPVPLRRALYRRLRPRTLEDKRAFLFDPRRLAERFALFQAITAPSLAKQTETDFTPVVLTSTELPRDWSERLNAIAARFRLRVERIAPDRRIPEAAARIAAEARSGTVVTMRLDDDDALAAEVVAQTRAMARNVQEPMAMVWPYGIHLRVVAGGAKQVSRFHSPWNSQGQALVEPRGAEMRTVFGLGAHTRIAEKVPTLSMPDRDSYIVASHVHNNSARFTRRRLDGQDALAFDDVPWHRFGIDADEVRRL